MVGRILVLSAVVGLAAAGSLAAQQPADGAGTYAKMCASCHGPQGTPSAAMARAMAGLPDFAAAAMASVPDSTLRGVIMNGKGRMMAAYKSRLTPEQITAVLAYLRTLAKH
ncbi:MAG TPA: cytochrome c [Gemmatimonadales bacterium]|nr:cytochrome c [Gemmatimonadales bacterium]